MPIKDVHVDINIASPAPRVGLGRPVIFTQKVGTSTYKEYFGLTDLAVDYPVGTPTYAKAKAVLDQKNRPDIVAVATYDTDIEASLTAYYDRPWHFALIAGDVAADQTTAAAFIDVKDFKFLAAQVKDDTQREALKLMKRTAVFHHPVVGEHLEAAAVGHLASLPVGSITWKFHELRGITPQYMSEDELAPIEQDNAIAYVMKGGSGELSEGTLSDGEYIDVRHGQDWVKVDMENEIQYMFKQVAEFETKLPFDNRGIGAIKAGATTTLERAYNNGIIAMKDDGTKDYIIDALSRAASDPQDRAERIYKGLSFEFGNAGAIHGARVKGAIRI